MTDLEKAKQWYAEWLHTRPHHDKTTSHGLSGLLAEYASHSNSELLERVQKLEQREKDLVATLARVQSNLGVAQYDIRKVAPDTRNV